MTRARELREFNEVELEHRLSEAKEELFNLRFQNATGQLDNSAPRSGAQDIAGSRRCCVSARSKPPRRSAPTRRRKMPDATDERHNPRKIREGLVVSTKMDKTVVVAVVDRVRHRRYGKTLQRTRRLYAHDEVNDAREGDRVRVQETRPLSRQKRWRVVEVLERAK
jgi:small subunit ribosomal protein S17